MHVCPSCCRPTSPPTSSTGSAGCWSLSSMGSPTSQSFLSDKKKNKTVIIGLNNHLTRILLNYRPGVQQCQAQGLVFCLWFGTIKNRTGMCKTKKSKFWAGSRVPSWYPVLLLDFAVHLVNFFGSISQGVILPSWVVRRRLLVLSQKLVWVERVRRNCRKNN